MELASLVCSPPPCLSRNRAIEIYSEPFNRTAEYITLCDVAGDVVEFGTYTGFTAMMLAQRMIATGKRLHLYDSWEGFPEMEGVDSLCKEVRDRKWNKGDLCLPNGFSDALFSTIDAVIPGMVSMVKGFYTHSTPVPKEISLLHIDCDLYNSTRIALDISAPSLSDGAVIMFDDFNNNLANNDFGERRAFMESIATSCEPWFTYGWSGYAFIYHKRTGA